MHADCIQQIPAQMPLLVRMLARHAKCICISDQRLLHLSGRVLWARAWDLRVGWCTTVFWRVEEAPQSRGKVRREQGVEDRTDSEDWDSEAARDHFFDEDNGARGEEEQPPDDGRGVVRDAEGWPESHVLGA
eukprot:2983255-Rhodomonas_salina.1